MLNVHKCSNVFLKKNKLDLLFLKKRGYILSSLSSVESIPTIHRTCFAGSGLAHYSRSSFKFSCSVTGKYGSTVGKLPLNRFILLKYMLFSKISFLYKKSW